MPRTIAHGLPAESVGRCRDQHELRRHPALRQRARPERDPRAGLPVPCPDLPAADLHPHLQLHRRLFELATGRAPPRTAAPVRCYERVRWRRLEARWCCGLSLHRASCSRARCYKRGAPSDARDEAKGFTDRRLRGHHHHVTIILNRHVGRRARWIAIPPFAHKLSVFASESLNPSIPRPPRHCAGSADSGHTLTAWDAEDGDLQPWPPGLRLHLHSLKDRLRGPPLAGTGTADPTEGAGWV
jgi:hypothetical protein